MTEQGQPTQGGNLQKPELTAKTLDNVRIIGEFVLATHGATQPEKAVFGPKVLKLADREFPDHGINANTFGVYLSTWGKDPSSRINTLGRRQGYYLISETHLEETTAVVDAPAAEETTTRKEKERLLSDSEVPDTLSAGDDIVLDNVWDHIDVEKPSSNSVATEGTPDAT